MEVASVADAVERSAMTRTRIIFCVLVAIPFLMMALVLAVPLLQGPAARQLF